MARKRTTYKFKLTAVFPYQYLLELCREHDLAVIEIQPAPTPDLAYAVTVLGDKNYIKFVHYLLNKFIEKRKEEWGLNEL